MWTGYILMVDGWVWGVKRQIWPKVLFQGWSAATGAHAGLVLHPDLGNVELGFNFSVAGLALQDIFLPTRL